LNTLGIQALLQRYPLEYFATLSTFGALSATTVQRLLAGGRIIQLPEGEVLYRSGSPVAAFFVLLAGKIALYRNYDVAPVAIRVYGPGEQIGFAAMIALHDRMNTAVTQAESLVLEVSSDQFFALHQDVPEDFGILLLNLAREMARTIGQQGDLIESLGRTGSGV